MTHQQLFWLSRAWRREVFHSRLWLLGTRDPRSRTTLEKSPFTLLVLLVLMSRNHLLVRLTEALTLFFPLELERYCSPNSSLIVYPTFSVATASWTLYHRSSAPSRTKAPLSAHISSNIRLMMATIRDLLDLFSIALAYSSRNDMAIIRRRWFPGAFVVCFRRSIITVYGPGTKSSGSIASSDC